MRFHVACKACDHLQPESKLWTNPLDPNHPLTWYVCSACAPTVQACLQEHTRCQTPCHACSLMGACAAVVPAATCLCFGWHVTVCEDLSCQNHACPCLLWCQVPLDQLPKHPSRAVSHHP
jgi:hypothetical protein